MRNEPVAQQLNSILVILGDISKKALKPDMYEEIKEEKATLYSIYNKTALIIDFLGAYNPPRFKKIRRRS
jgi:hypothetical protein